MRRWIAALLCLAIGDTGVSPVSAAINREQMQRCQERALFAGQVATAKARGLTQDQVRERLATIVRTYPELGVPEAELAEMLGTVQRVWTWPEQPEAATGRYFAECVDSKES